MFAKFARIIKNQERRKDRRAPAKLRASVGDAEGRIMDISLGGCGFYPQAGLLKMGEEIAITLHLPEGDIIIPAKVAGHDKEKVVYGIAFLELTPMIFDILQKIIIGRSTPAH